MLWMDKPSFSSASRIWLSWRYIACPSRLISLARSSITWETPDSCSATNWRLSYICLFQRISCWYSSYWPFITSSTSPVLPQIRLHSGGSWAAVIFGHSSTVVIISVIYR
ncbi:hypothetical protein D3C87_1464080 [compost metagenome]